MDVLKLRNGLVRLVILVEGLAIRFFATLSNQLEIGDGYTTREHQT